MPDNINHNQNPSASSSSEPAQPVTNRRILYLSKLYSHQLSDMGNAHRFVAQYGHRLRYVPTRGWFLYNGTRWTLDETNQVLDLAYASLQFHYDEACALPNCDKDLCQRILLHTEHSQSSARLKALLYLATSIPGVSLPASAFNSDPYLLNFLNGTFDLRTRTLLPHNPANYLTQLILINYNPEATSDLLTSFLTHLTNSDADYLTYLQLAIGSSLTGFSSGGLCFILTGPSQSTQQAFLTLLGHLFASYSAHLPTFQRRQLSPTLLNARLLTTSTSTFLQDSDPLLLTTFLDSEPCTLFPSSPTCSTYRPQATVWASLPNPPQLNPKLSHLRDRLKFLPISYQLSAQEGRKIEQHLPDLLQALLAWAVQGALQWLDEALSEPHLITQACLNYLEEQDGLSSFFETRCVRGSAYHVSAHELYLAYALWCNQHHLSPLPEQKFGRFLVERKFIRVRHSDGRTYYGLALIETPISSNKDSSISSAYYTHPTSFSDSVLPKEEMSSYSLSQESPKEEMSSYPISHGISLSSTTPEVNKSLRSTDLTYLFGDPSYYRPNSPPEER